MFANVPRIITSWLPRRAPYELKSAVCTPCGDRYFAAGLVLAMFPAGEMWSVVTESPSMASTRALRMSRPGGSSRHAVEVGRVAHVGRGRLPAVDLALGTSMLFQARRPGTRSK